MDFIILLFIFVPSRLINIRASNERNMKKENTPTMPTKAMAIEFSWISFQCQRKCVKTLEITTARIIKGLFLFLFFSYLNLFFKRVERVGFPLLLTRNDNCSALNDAWTPLNRLVSTTLQYFVVLTRDSIMFFVLFNLHIQFLNFFSFWFNYHFCLTPLIELRNLRIYVLTAI